ncbi:hypothetical protein MMPV_000958 [Pyropia vietnamensis]
MDPFARHVAVASGIAPDAVDALPGYADLAAAAAAAATARTTAAAAAVRRATAARAAAWRALLPVAVARELAIEAVEGGPPALNPTDAAHVRRVLAMSAARAAAVAAAAGSPASPATAPMGGVVGKRDPPSGPRWSSDDTLLRPSPLSPDALDALAEEAPLVGDAALTRIGAAVDGRLRESTAAATALVRSLIAADPELMAPGGGRGHSTDWRGGGASTDDAFFSSDSDSDSDGGAGDSDGDDCGSCGFDAPPSLATALCRLATTTTTAAAAAAAATAAAAAIRLATTATTTVAATTAAAAASTAAGVPGAFGAAAAAEAAARAAATVAKADAVRAAVAVETYPPETVAALRSLRGEVEARRRAATAAAAADRDRLAAYEAAGDELATVAAEADRLRRAIADKRWALEELERDVTE